MAQLRPQRGLSERGRSDASSSLHRKPAPFHIRGVRRQERRRRPKCLRSAAAAVETAAASARPRRTLGPPRAARGAQSARRPERTNPRKPRRAAPRYPRLGRRSIPGLPGQLALPSKELAASFTPSTRIIARRGASGRASSGAAPLATACGSRPEPALTSGDANSAAASPCGYDTKRATTFRLWAARFAQLPEANSTASTARPGPGPPGRAS